MKHINPTQFQFCALQQPCNLAPEDQISLDNSAVGVQTFHQFFLQTIYYFEFRLFSLGSQDLGEMGLFHDRPTSLVLYFLPLDLLLLYISTQGSLLCSGLRVFMFLMLQNRLNTLFYIILLYCFLHFIRDHLVLLLYNDIVILGSPIDILLWPLVGH